MKQMLKPAPVAGFSILENAYGWLAREASLPAGGCLPRRLKNFR